MIHQKFILINNIIFFKTMIALGGSETLENPAITYTPRGITNNITTSEQNNIFSEMSWPIVLLLLKAGLRTTHETGTSTLLNTYSPDSQNDRTDNVTKKIEHASKDESHKNRTNKTSSITNRTDGNDKNKTRQRRTVFTPRQLAGLEGRFQKNQYIYLQHRPAFAEKLKLTETQVKIWFQNRRAKENKKLASQHKTALQYHRYNNILTNLGAGTRTARALLQRQPNTYLYNPPTETPAYAPRLPYHTINLDHRKTLQFANSDISLLNQLPSCF